MHESPGYLCSRMGALFSGLRTPYAERIDLLLEVLTEHDKSGLKKRIEEDFGLSSRVFPSCLYSHKEYIPM